MRVKVGLGVVCFAAIVLVGASLLARFHAESMTRWSADGERTRKPEELNVFDRLGVLVRGVEIPRPENLETPADHGLAFERHEYESASGHRLEAWYLPAGESPVLFVGFHGYASSKASLLHVAEMLHDMGHSSLLVDFFGSGGSSGYDTSLGVREAHDVEASLEYCRQRWPDSKLIVYGESMGAVAALRSSAQSDTSPDGFVLVATFDRLLSTVKNRFRSMGVPATPLAHLLVHWGGVLTGIDGFEHNPSEYATSVRCPALVLHGSHDRRVTVEQARLVYDKLGGWKQFVEFEQAGHTSLHSTDPELWRASIHALVKQVVEQRMGTQR